MTESTVSNVIILNADDEEPICLRCDNFGEPYDDICEKCGNTGWSCYHREVLIADKEVEDEVSD